MSWMVTFGRKDILRLANKYISGVNLRFISWGLFYIFDSSVPFLIIPFIGGNSKVSQEIVLFFKGVDPESKAEDTNGNTYK